jgi:hypothetical protein
LDSEFGSNTGRFGAGVVVFHEGRVMGGDNGYFYRGTYALVGVNEFRATIDVTPFVDGIRLVLTGTIADGAHATAQGHPLTMPNLALGVKLTKRS